MPYLPDKSSPIGKNEEENVQIRQWGDEYIPQNSGILPSKSRHPLKNLSRLCPFPKLDNHSEMNLSNQKLGQTLGASSVR